MKKAISACLFLLLAGCLGEDGTLEWILEEKGGIPLPPELTLEPGETGQVGLELRAEGGYEGVYLITATPQDVELESAVVVPTSGEVRTGEPLAVVVTITVAAGAEPSYASKKVKLLATPQDGAGDDTWVQILVRIPQ